MRCDLTRALSNHRIAGAAHRRVTRQHEVHRRCADSADLGGACGELNICGSPRVSLCTHVARRHILLHGNTKPHLCFDVFPFRCSVNFGIATQACLGIAFELSGEKIMPQDCLLLLRLCLDIRHRTRNAEGPCH